MPRQPFSPHHTTTVHSPFSPLSIDKYLLETVYIIIKRRKLNFLWMTAQFTNKNLKRFIKYNGRWIREKGAREQLVFPPFSINQKCIKKKKPCNSKYFSLLREIQLRPRSNFVALRFRKTMFLSQESIFSLRIDLNPEAQQDRWTSQVSNRK